MKKVVSFVLAAILFVSSFPLYTFAAQDDVSENVYDDMYENYQVVMEGWTWNQYLQNDSNFGFVIFSQKVDESPFLRGVINVALSIADGIDIYKFLFDGTDALSGADVEVGFYENAILSLLMTMEQDVSGSLEQQAKADATMTLKDYMVDGTEAVAGTVTGLFADSTAVAQSLAILVDGLSGSMDVLSKTIDSLETQEQYASLSQYMRNYGQFERVLNAIQDHSTDQNLKQAARNVQNALQQCFEYKMDHFTDYLEDAALSNLSSFFFDDVLKQVLEKENLEITGLSTMCNLSQGIAAFNAGAKLGSFFANSVFGSNDIFLRYFEMRAMAQIRDCLIPEVSNLEKNVTGAQDYQEIQKVQSYLYCLLYTCSRGEYCMYSMLDKDARLTKVVAGKNSEEFQEWYTDACEFMEYAKENIDNISLNIEENPIDLLSDEELIDVANGQIQEVCLFEYSFAHGAAFDVDEEGIEYVSGEYWNRVIDERVHDLEDVQNVWHQYFSSDYPGPDLDRYQVIDGQLYAYNPGIGDLLGEAKIISVESKNDNQVVCRGYWCWEEDKTELTYIMAFEDEAWKCAGLKWEMGDTLAYLYTPLKK